jgi:ferredoxin-type protein NapH
VAKRSLKTNRLMRLGGFVVGIALFYAPFQLLLRALGAVLPAATVAVAGSTGAPTTSTLPGLVLAWFAAPWQWPAAGDISAWWLPVAALPLIAVVTGPVFCGWLCPAGALPELLGRLVPDRLKVDLREHIDIVPVRLGFFVGFVLAPAVLAALWMQFGYMKEIVNGIFANSVGFAYFSWVSVLTMAVWIVPMGLFTKGGRGWCMFMCPTGTIMGGLSWLTARLPLTSRIRVDASCTACGACTGVCPTRALGVKSSTRPDEAPILTVEHNLCNECLDCTAACPERALRYGRV